MSRYAGKWPLCTVPGCGHVRTQRDDDDVPALTAIWATVDGRAVCSCHVLLPAGPMPIALFPCDVTS